MNKAKLTLFINGSPLYRAKDVELDFNGQYEMSYEDANTGMTDEHKLEKETWIWKPEVKRLVRHSSLIEMDFDAARPTQTTIYSPFGNVERTLNISVFRYQEGDGEFRFDIEYYFEDAPQEKTDVVLMIEK